VFLGTDLTDGRTDKFPASTTRDQSEVDSDITDSALPRTGLDSFSSIHVKQATDIMQSYCGLVGVSFQALPLRGSGDSQLRVIVNRLHHSANRIYDNVRAVNDDEMATLFRNYLLAVSRKRQFSLELDVSRTTHRVCADIHEWLIAQRLSMRFGDCLGLRSALHRDFVVSLKSHLISSLRDSPKMTLTVALG